MANQFLPSCGGEKADLIDTIVPSPEAVEMLCSCGTDSSNCISDTRCFGPNLHLILSSAFWRAPFVCSTSKATAIVDTCPDTPDNGYFTPEAWIKFRSA